MKDCYKLRKNVENEGTCDETKEESKDEDIDSNCILNTSIK